jgi:hypothetical protein
MSLEDDSTDMNVVLALMVNSYETPEAKAAAHKKVMEASMASAVLQPKVAKVKVPKVKAPKIQDPKDPKFGKEETPIVPVEPGASAALIGDNDAEAFLKNYRAGKNREEYIKAINQYVGYDTAKNFGEQEYRAVSAARLATAKKVENPIVVHSRIDAAVTGFIAGMPDHRKKDKQNLLARELAAVDAMRECEKLASDKSLSESERAVQRGFAKVEQERIVQIRKDLKAYGM